MPNEPQWVGEVRNTIQRGFLPAQDAGEWIAGNLGWVALAVGAYFLLPALFGGRRNK